MSIFSTIVRYYNSETPSNPGQALKTAATYTAKAVTSVAKVTLATAIAVKDSEATAYVADVASKAAVSVAQFALTAAISAKDSAVNYLYSHLFQTAEERAYEVFKDETLTAFFADQDMDLTAAQQQVIEDTICSAMIDNFAEYEANLAGAIDAE